MKKITVICVKRRKAVESEVLKVDDVLLFGEAV